jgi:hypothetical protein
VWVVGLQIFHNDASIDVAHLSEKEVNGAFQLPELWNETHLFRWSTSSATLQLPPFVSDYLVVDVVAVGHTAPQSVDLQYRFNTTQTITFNTTNQQFRHHLVLIKATPFFVPVWQDPTLTINTEMLATQNREIGLGVQRIQMTRYGVYGLVFLWEMLWVALCFWVCVCMLSPIWRLWRWRIVVSVLVMVVLAEYYAVPRVIQRYSELTAMLIFFDYRRLPQVFRAFMHRVTRWMLRWVSDASALQQHIVSDWFTSVGLVGIGVGAVLYLRQGNPAESWDKYIFLVVFAVSVAYHAIKTMLDTFVARDIRYRILLRTIVITSWVLLIINGFQYEAARADTIPRFAGFGLWFLLLIMLTSPVIRWLLDDTTTNHWRAVLTYGVATWVVVASGFALVVGSDYYHDLFVINETLTPAVNRFAYDDFVPQYTTMFNGIVALFVYGYPQYTPSMIIDFVTLIIKMTAVVTSGVLVYVVYRILPKPTWAKAIIITLPTVFMASYPVWDRIIVSTPSVDIYSIVPVRYFSLIMIGFVGTTVLQYFKQHIRPSMHILLGLVAGLVIFNNNDFGFMAAFALGIMIMVNPYLTSWKQTALHAAGYMAGIILFFPVVACINWVWYGRQFNDAYIFWFVRQFGGGFGALMIRYPGPGILIIALAIPLAIAALRSVLLPVRAHLLTQPPRVMYAYLQLIYFAVASCMSLLYYLNRSTANNLGITLIPLIVAFVSLWAIDGSVTRRRQSVMQYALHSIVAMPIVLGIVFMNTPDIANITYRFSDVIATERNHAIQRSATGSDSESLLPVASAKETAQLLTSFGFHPAYYGPWANTMQVYAQIPTALIFNSPFDSLFGGQTQKILCAHTFPQGIDVLIMAKQIIPERLTCPNFVVYDSPVLPLPIAINREDTKFDIYATQIADIISQCSGVTAPCTQVQRTQP